MVQQPIGDEPPGSRRDGGVLSPSWTETLARGLYSGLYIPVSPLILGYLVSRPDSRRRLADYFGRNSFDGAPPGHGGIWAHAVSAGEALSVAPLVERLARGLERLSSTVPDRVLTTTIQDALLLVESRCPETYTSRTFLPLDFPVFVERWLDTVRPRVLLVSEMDLWPNLLVRVGQRGIPAYLINGRVSPRNARALTRLRPLYAGALRAFRRIWVQREVDRERLSAAGMPPGKIEVAGNTKYERPGGAPPAPGPPYDALRKDPRLVLVAGSTHAPEEEILARVRREACEGGQDVLLVLVPRNLERVHRLVPALKECGGGGVALWSTVCRRGDLEPITAGTILVDTFGELDALYGTADVAYVGGGFGRFGGHNLLEPAWHGVPLVCGPDMENFRTDVQAFESAGALAQVPDEERLVQEVLRLLADAGERSRMGRAARETVEAGQGLSARIAETILEDLR